MQVAPDSSVSVECLKCGKSLQADDQVEFLNAVWCADCARLEASIRDRIRSRRAPLVEEERLPETRVEPLPTSTVAPERPATQSVPSPISPTPAASSTNGHRALPPPQTDAPVGRAEVIDVVNRMLLAIDLGEWARVRASLADAVVVHGLPAATEPKVWSGSELTELLRRWTTVEGPSQHLAGSHVVTIEGDHAQCLLHVVLWHDSSAPQLPARAVFRISLVSLKGGWRACALTWIPLGLRDRSDAELALAAV